MNLNDINSLSHTKWNCKYHIVFALKYRRKVFYKEKRAASNNPRAAGRPYYAFTRYARNGGLCPHRKNPQFYWGGYFFAAAGNRVQSTLQTVCQNIAKAHFRLLIDCIFDDLKKQESVVSFSR